MRRHTGPAQNDIDQLERHFESKATPEQVEALKRSPSLKATAAKTKPAPSSPIKEEKLSPEKKKPRSAPATQKVPPGPALVTPKALPGAPALATPQASGRPATGTTTASPAKPTKTDPASKTPPSAPKGRSLAQDRAYIACACRLVRKITLYVIRASFALLGESTASSTGCSSTSPACCCEYPIPEQ